MRKTALLPLLVLLVISIFLVSCQNGDVAPKSTPEPTAPPAMDPPPAAMDAPTTPMDAPPLVLPMIDRSCATKADCVVTANPKIEDGVCCLGCPSLPAARSWAEQVVRLCDQYNARNQVSGCPKVKCSDVPDVACVQGECQFQ